MTKEEHNKCLYKAIISIIFGFLLNLIPEIIDLSNSSKSSIIFINCTFLIFGFSLFIFGLKRLHEYSQFSGFNQTDHDNDLHLSGENHNLKNSKKIIRF